MWSIARNLFAGPLNSAIMPIGIRPTNDFAFKKIFGSPENERALISLLNSILGLPVPIVDVTIANPFNLKDFQDDKLSVVDIKAVDQSARFTTLKCRSTFVKG